nr:hypothetical protein [Tanacetum cinerariifolium]
MVKRMASMNTRLNTEKLNGNIIQKHGGSKQVGFKQLGPGVETGVHEVDDEKRVWFEVELQGAQGDREAEVFQRPTQQCMKSGVAKHLGFAGIQQQNGLVDETNVILFAKVLLYNLVSRDFGILNSPLNYSLRMFSPPYSSSTSEPVIRAPLKPISSPPSPPRRY